MYERTLQVKHQCVHRCKFQVLLGETLRFGECSDHPFKLVDIDTAFGDCGVIDIQQQYDCSNLVHVSTDFAN